MKKLKMFLLFQLMIISLLTGCNSDDKKSNDGKNENATNESGSENKNTITPTDTINGLELVASYAIPENSDERVFAYKNCFFTLDDNSVHIKDIYGHFDKLLYECEGPKLLMSHPYYAEDYMYFIVATEDSESFAYDRFHIIVVADQGKITYVDEIDYEIYFNGTACFLNNDGNLIYVDINNNLVCINPNTCEVVYKQNLGETMTNNSFNRYFAKIENDKNNKIYDLSTGAIVYEVTTNLIEISKNICYQNQEIYLIDSNIAIIERDTAGDVSKYFVYDKTGTLSYSNDNPDEIPAIYEIGWNNSMLCKKRNSDSLFTGFMILKADLTPIVSNCKEQLELINEDSTYLEYACESGISIYTNSLDNYGYIVTNTEVIEFTCLEPLPFSDWYVTYIDTQNKRYVLNMANGAKIEVEPTDDIVFGSDITQVSPKNFQTDANQGQTIYFYEVTDTLTNVFDENGSLLFSQENEGSNVYVYGSVDMHQLLLCSENHTVVYNADTGEQIKLSKDELPGNAITIVKDNYLMFTQTDSETNAVTLKQVNLETKETIELLTAPRHYFWFSDDILIAANTRSDDDINYYDIYTYK